MDKLQEVGGALIGEDRLVIIAGAGLVVWYQMVSVCLMPFTLFQTLL
jgi:hypothetical protein